MNIETVNQANLFFIFTINGIIIGIIFDSFRILRKSFHTSNIITYIEDALFWLISSLIVMYSVFRFNNGQFRAYMFIGIIIGIFIYMLLLSKTIINFSISIISVLKKLLVTILKIVVYPFRLFARYINKSFIYPVIKLFSKVNSNIKRFSKKIKKK